MISVFLTAAGGIILTISVAFYRCDCRGKPSSTMGGEMSFSVFWTFGLIALLLGWLPLLGVSRWWTVPGVAVLYAASFPFRNLLRLLFCTPCKKETTGFQEHVRKIRDAAGRAAEKTL